MKKIAIVQSNYIPWKGYFDLIASVDEFILYDDMQYTRRDWRNRNQIKTSQGIKWLTIPVKVKGKYDQKIRETEIDGHEWGAAHWKALEQNYRRAAHFDEISTWLKPLYFGDLCSHLSPLNRRFLVAICNYLGIKSKITDSSAYILLEGKTERLADLCKQAGATEYISGPSARNYIQMDEFTKRGVNVFWADYTGYPEYPQLWGKFSHEVTILDLLFNCGKNSHLYMRNVVS